MFRDKYLFQIACKFYLYNCDIVPRCSVTEISKYILYSPIYTRNIIKYKTYAYSTIISQKRFVGE